MNYFYIISDTTDPYWNLAMEEALFEYADEETTILFLWQNDHTIVIGRNQDAYIECKVDQFLADGGQLARRRSGGGAVYHDLGNLNFSIICLEAAAKKTEYQQLVAKTLEYFGLEVLFNGRNDLLVFDKKFSGNAFYTNGRILCQHGTILVNTDIKKMDCYLTPNEEKLNRNYVKSVASRVVNLSSFSPELTVEKIQQAMIYTAKAKVLQAKLDKKKVNTLLTFYKGEKWIFQGMSDQIIAAKNM
ncbi:MAG: lipoate--protein ligase family protein [Lachnospiraceae bacterium]|nr:lipoate--protein ligase family protein [Lachnospiraceae bacterium]